MSNIEIKAMLEKLGAIDVADLFTQDKSTSSSCEMCGNEHDLEEDCPIDEWANSPEGVEGDPMIDEPDAHLYRAGGINGPKGAYAASQRGDNAMAVEESTDTLESRIKAELTALYKL